MTLEKIVTPKIEIELFGKKYKCEMKLRNYAVLLERTGVKEHDLLQGLMRGDPKYLAYAIWAATLEFAPFDEAEPLKLKKEAPLQKIFQLTLKELNEIGNEVIKAVQAALPEPSEKEKKVAEKKTKKNKSMK